MDFNTNFNTLFNVYQQRQQFAKQKFDVNGDGKIDEVDKTALKNQENELYANGALDFNNDGKTDFMDLFDLGSNLDLNGNGKIDDEERTFINEYAEKMGSELSKDADNSVAEVINNTVSTIKDELNRTVIEKDGQDGTCIKNFDSNGRVISIENVTEKITYKYNSDGSYTQVKTSYLTGTVTTYKKDAAGKTLSASSKTSKGVVTNYTYKYNADGSYTRTATNKSTGTVTTTKYNGDNKPVSSTTKNKKGKTTSTTTYKYNADGSYTKTATNKSTGAVTTTKYNADNKPVSLTTKNKKGKTTSTTTYKYNTDGSYTQVIRNNESGATTTKKYDNQSRLVSSVAKNKKGKTTSSETRTYNSDGTYNVTKKDKNGKTKTTKNVSAAETVSISRKINWTETLLKADFLGLPHMGYALELDTQKNSFLSLTGKTTTSTDNTTSDRSVTITAQTLLEQLKNNSELYDKLKSSMTLEERQQLIKQKIEENIEKTFKVFE